MNTHGLVNMNQQNETTGKHIHNYSRFSDSLSYLMANTLRFGDIVPSFVMESVPDDKIKLNTKDYIDSLSLNAPFKGQIRKIKSTFKVPNMAILPLNWDRIYAQPSNGDDVPVGANCVLEDFPWRFQAFWLPLFQLLASNLPDNTATNASISAWLTALIRVLVCGEHVYSYGSLLNLCGYKLSGSFNQTVTGFDSSSYDSMFDRFISYCFSKIGALYVSWPVGSTTRFASFFGLHANSKDVYNHMDEFRQLIDLFRENPLATITQVFYISSDVVNDDATYGAYLQGMATLSPYNYFNTPIFSLPSTHPASDDLTDLHPSTLDLSRVFAYQLCCFHFFTNSSIDFVYTAELYRQYVHSLENLAMNSSAELTFSWNGISCPYDYLSGEYVSRSSYMTSNGSSVAIGFTYAHLSSSGVVTNPAYILKRFAVFSSIFGIRHSLRYGDYFVGSRPRPLAPINTDVAVNSNKVSVVDITRNIQGQRFANAVMRSRSKIEEYTQALFGRRPQPDFHNPFYLSEEVELIYGEDVQNTGDAQVLDANSRTANFSSNLGRYTFELENDDAHPCIFIQLISFDIKRAYTRTIDRHFLYRDRYDMFNPDFQYIGDQPVYGMELGYDYGYQYPDVFAYQTRDAEYKQRFDVCSGGFVESLPGWLLLDTQSQSSHTPYLNPDFIRNANFELDHFFLSLTGFSLGHYFHFICLTKNNVDARRPMAVDPQILA